MEKELFYQHNRYQSISIEMMLESCATFEEFEAKFSDELLAEDGRVGQYLQELLIKYDKKNTVISERAGLNRSFVGNIINGKKIPGRDSIIAICLAIGTTFEEVQYLLKYAGHAPLYVRRKRDVIIWFGFMKKRSIYDVDVDLLDHGLKTFFKHED